VSGCCWSEGCADYAGLWVGSSCLSIDPYVPYPTRVSDFRSSVGKESV